LAGLHALSENYAQQSGSKEDDEKGQERAIELWHRGVRLCTSPTLLCQDISVIDARQQPGIVLFHPGQLIFAACEHAPFRGVYRQDELSLAAVTQITSQRRD
jgi:hypothetical protein